MFLASIPIGLRSSRSRWFSARLLVACSAFLGFAVHAQQALTLDQALRAAQDWSLQLVAQDAAAAAAREMAVAAGQRPDPTLKLSVNNLPIDGPDRFSLSRDFMTMRSLGAMQEFTRSDKLRARSARFDREAEAAEAARAVALAALRRDTAMAWLDRYHQALMLELLRTQRAEAGLQIDAADAAYRGGPAHDKSLRIERGNDTKATLLVGEQESPFPFPLVKGARGWQFDAKAGAEEIVNRRIGENELFAIKSCLAYSDAQQEYAEADRDGDGIIEYAQKFHSSKGKREGLFWPTKADEPLSPLGPLFEQVKREGYSANPKPTPIHGYYYRILTSQSKNAPGGAYDYLVKGNMIGGYALVAYPARWGASGVMTFTCNHDGVVYQKNFGSSTADVASKIKHFNPDAGWRKAE